MFGAPGFPSLYFKDKPTFEFLKLHSRTPTLHPVCGRCTRGASGTPSTRPGDVQGWFRFRAGGECQAAIAKLSCSTTSAQGGPTLGRWRVSGRERGVRQRLTQLSRQSCPGDALLDVPIGDIPPPPETLPLETAPCDAQGLMHSCSASVHCGQRPPGSDLVSPLTLLVNSGISSTCPSFSTCCP